MRDPTIDEHSSTIFCLSHRRRRRRAFPAWRRRTGFWSRASNRTDLLTCTCWKPVADWVESFIPANGMAFCWREGPILSFPKSRGPCRFAIASVWNRASSARARLTGAVSLSGRTSCSRCLMAFTFWHRRAFGLRSRRRFSVGLARFACRQICSYRERNAPLRQRTRLLPVSFVAGWGMKPWTEWHSR